MGIKKIIAFSFIFLFSVISAQETQDSLKTPETPKASKANITFLDKKASVRVLLIGDYANSLTDDVDIYGTNNPEASSNGFYLKYARINTKFNINKKLLIQVLVNLADFSGDPKNKVLEIAAIKWNANPYLNFQFGQFRPYFGLEDMYPAEVMKSNAWSKQYSLMSKSNWQSFQIGASVSGSLSPKNIPLRYYYTIYNGNGKNQTQDNDDAKNHAFRLEYDLFKGLQLGGSAAFTKIESQSADIYGVDLEYAKKFSETWEFDVNTEYKTGANNYAFRADTSTDKNIKDYRMEGFYFTPSISKQLNAAIESFLEFSFRYEYLQDVKHGNPGRFYTPMLSYVIGKDYTSKISLVGVFSDYNYNVSGTSQYDSNILLLQYQLRF